MTVKKNIWIAAILCSLLFAVLVACSFPEVDENGTETTATAPTDTTVATLGTVTRPTDSTTSPTPTGTTQSTTADKTALPPVSDEFPNETEDGDTKRY